MDPNPEASPRSGTVPPVEHRFKPGQSGNPKGRPSAGAAIKEWINQLAAEDLDEDALRALMNDRKTPVTKRTAALRLLRMVEVADISNFAGLLRGVNWVLEDLRGLGITTEVVRKFKQKTRKVPMGEGEVEEVIEREIEFHDRSGDEFDRVMDRTEGRPKQEIVQHVDGSIRTVAEGTDQAASLLASIRERFAPHGN